MTRTLFTLFTLVCFTGCTTLQPLPDAQPATIQQSVRPGSIVEIERVDGTRTVLKVESVGAEAIEGTESGQRLRIPLGEIRSIGTQTVAKSATLWTVIGLLVVVGGVIAASDSDGGSGGGY